ncbi:MAG: reverse transcriptase/maturase family protein [Bacteroidales bacterium]|jgi:retron-type reverse transcriptase|nr:reverse transcriptase/maturase family protein [Bacteroidales bacterium]
MDIDDVLFSDNPPENLSVLKTENEIDSFIKENLSVHGIMSIFDNYIIKHNIIGIDNIDNNSFRKNISLHADHIFSSINSYKYSPYMEKLISKGRNKNPRIISIPTIKDRIVLYTLKEMLHEIFPECVNNQLVNTKIKGLSGIILHKETGDIIKIDIKGFYDSINQQILFDKIRTRIKSNVLLSLIEKAITNPTVPKKYAKCGKDDYYQYLGIPQGLAISNILANIYLGDFDGKISQKCEYYYRYVDDILLVCNENESRDLYTKIKNDLQRIGLNLNSEKTKTLKIHESFDFLGYKIGEHALSISAESIQKFIDSLFALLCNYKRLKDHKEARESWLTDELLPNRFQSEINERITGAISEKKKYGWLFYFSAMNDMSILYKLNAILKSALTRIFPSNFLSKVEIKNFVKAYYAIRNNPKSGYIENYDNFDTILKKREYLEFRGYIDRTKEYTADEIEYKFNTIRERNLLMMQRDIGSLS